MNQDCSLFSPPSLGKYRFYSELPLAAALRWRTFFPVGAVCQLSLPAPRNLLLNLSPEDSEVKRWKLLLFEPLLVEQKESVGDMLRILRIPNHSCGSSWSDSIPGEVTKDSRMCALNLYQGFSSQWRMSL